LVKFNDYLCENPTLSRVDSEFDEIQCSFRQGDLYGKTSCNLFVEIENFGEIYVSDELRDNCIINIPYISGIINGEIGTEGGAVVEIQGAFLSNMFSQCFEKYGYVRYGSKIRIYGIRICKFCDRCLQKKIFLAILNNFL